MADKQSFSSKNESKRKWVDRDRYEAARDRTKKLVRGGLLAGLAWLFLMLAGWLPNVSLSFRFFAACILLVACLRLGVKGGSLVFLVTGLLALAYPGLVVSLPFYLYFGPYVLLVFWLNSWKQGTPIVLFRVLLGTGLVLLLGLIYGEALIPVPVREQVAPYFWPVLFLVGLIGTAIFDYILGLGANLYARYATHLTD